jgi:hypothetical protein
MLMMMRREEKVMCEGKRQVGETSGEEMDG